LGSAIFKLRILTTETGWFEGSLGWPRGHFGSFQALGRVLSRGRRAGSGGALFVGRVAIAERGQRAFKRLFCAFWESIGKRVEKG
jgi:hypothetical protein